MIREFRLGQWLTLANAVCGTGAPFSMMSYLQSNQVMHVYLACRLVLAAVAFDVLVGRIARWRQQASMIGRELDSLGLATSSVTCAAFQAAWHRPSATSMAQRSGVGTGGRPISA